MSSLALPRPTLPGVVDTLLPLFGVGPVLVVGTDNDALVATLRQRGIATTGADAASDLTALPYGDGAGGTLIVRDVLEYARPETLDAIARELYRVSTRYLFVRVSTRRVDPARPLSTEWSRQPWENCFLQAGFMRHPLGFNVTPYEARDDEGPQILLAFERLPAGVDHRFSLDDLRAERNLHMDMLRESGRRADAHIARYHLAAQFVRPGDRVLDAACGLGYGAAVLHDATLARSVEGLDNSPFAIDYCRSECGAHRPRTSFAAGDITDLERRDAASVDVVVSFETMEHIDDPEAFVRNVSRLLTPGGRLICSVPNLWVDETGRDPNPYHFHVFDRDKLLAVCGKFLLIEQLFGETAGNGFKKTAERRRMTPVALSDRDADPEWWVLVAVKPVDGDDALRLRTQLDATMTAAAAATRRADLRAETERRAAARHLAERDARIVSLTRSLLRFAIPDPRGFVVFGAGQGGRNAIARLRSLGGHVSCVVDNREAAWDTEVDRVRVLSPVRLRSQPFAMIVIASSIGHDAIARQLTEMGFVAGEHFITSETIR